MGEHGVHGVGEREAGTPRNKVGVKGELQCRQGMSPHLALELHGPIGFRV
jgi:hypothetical protein